MMLTILFSMALAEEDVDSPLSMAGLSKTELVEYDYENITVGNPNPMNGDFFTQMWGNATSDADVRELIFDYSPITWDSDLGLFRFDHTVVSNALISDDSSGNRTYELVFYRDMTYSDGTPVTAWDYAFSILFQCDPVIREIDGVPENYDYLVGYEEYADGTVPYFEGLRVLDDYRLALTVKDQAMPYFYELMRLNILPYPISAIAPGYTVRDDGNGVYLSNDNSGRHSELDAGLLRETVLDPETGYRFHPDPVTGAYKLVSFDGMTAVLEINPYYKGDENGNKPDIGKLTYTFADNQTMIDSLQEGEYALLNKVTFPTAISDGINLSAEKIQFTFSNYSRSGLTYLSFDPASERVQDLRVRQAIACCMDTDRFVSVFLGDYGQRVDGMWGLGQWMYLVAEGAMSVPNLAAWQGTALEDITRYEFDIQRAARLLEASGWTYNENGEAFDPASDTIRYAQTENGLVKLELKMGYPETTDIAALFEKYLCEPLKEAGAELTLVPMNMRQVVDAYTERDFGGLDLMFVGDNFDICFDPTTIFDLDGTASGNVGDSLGAVYAEMYRLSEDMMRTEWRDLDGYMGKWVRFQKQLTQLLPMIPLSSNVYFDFYTQELHDYDITRAASWAEAIIPAQMSGLLDVVQTGLEIDTLEPEDEPELADYLNTEYSEGDTQSLLAALPEDIRIQIPENYGTADVAFAILNAEGDLPWFISVIYSLPKEFSEGQDVKVLFGVPGEDGETDWFVRDGRTLADGRIGVALGKESIEMLNGATCALIVMSE